VPRASVLLLEKIHPTADQGFEPADVSIHRVNAGLSEDEIIEEMERLPDGPIIVGIRSKTRITGRVIESVPRLIAIGAFCIGTDQIDLKTARARGVAVFNAPFSNTRSVAELVMAEVVILSRQIFPRSVAAHRGEWRKTVDGAHEVRGKTLGIVGYGHIGTQLSILAEAFGMKVLFFDIQKKLPLGNATPAATLDDLLGQSHFVTLHVPDTELTRGMIGKAEVSAMRPGAYLINASRGKVVDIGALRDALTSGHVSGAAIDVFPREPKGNDDGFETELQGLENVILTPHIGGSTLEAQAAIGHEVSAALVGYLNLGSTTSSVNMPKLEAPPPVSVANIPACRIINIHQNQPGVLSKINQVIAGSNVNIVGQSLRTLEDVGLLFIDIPLSVNDDKAGQLKTAIGSLGTSLRTRIVPL